MRGMRDKVKILPTGIKVKVATVECPKCKHVYIPRNTYTLRCPRCFHTYK